MMYKKYLAQHQVPQTPNKRLKTFNTLWKGWMRRRATGGAYGSIQYDLISAQGRGSKAQFKRTGVQKAKSQEWRQKRPQLCTDVFGNSMEAMHSTPKSTPPQNRQHFGSMNTQTKSASCALHSKPAELNPRMSYSLVLLSTLIWVLIYGQCNP